MFPCAVELQTSIVFDGPRQITVILPYPDSSVRDRVTLDHVTQDTFFQDRIFQNRVFKTVSFNIK